MSQNRTTGGPEDVSGTGSGGSLSTTGDAGADAPASGAGSSASTGLATAGPASGGVGERAKEYGQTVADAASTAKEYLTDKAGVVGEKIQGLRDVDYAEYANQAKDYARQNTVQALLIAAAAGFVVGFLMRPPGDPTTPPPPPRKRR